MKANILVVVTSIVLTRCPKASSGRYDSRLYIVQVKVRRWIAEHDGLELRMRIPNSEDTVLFINTRSDREHVLLGKKRVDMLGSGPQKHADTITSEENSLVTRQV